MRYVAGNPPMLEGYLRAIREFPGRDQHKRHVYVAAICDFEAAALSDKALKQLALC